MGWGGGLVRTYKHDHVYILKVANKGKDHRFVWQICCAG